MSTNQGNMLEHVSITVAAFQMVFFAAPLSLAYLPFFVAGIAALLSGEVTGLLMLIPVPFLVAGWRMAIKFVCEGRAGLRTCHPASEVVILTACVLAPLEVHIWVTGGSLYPAPALADGMLALGIPAVPLGIQLLIERNLARCPPDAGMRIRRWWTRSSSRARCAGRSGAGTAS